MLKVCTILDYGHLPKKKPIPLRLLVSLEASPEEASPAAPLNLAVVLDRSGSMSGSKLAGVRQATRALFGQLRPDDIFSLVAYDDEVEDVVLPTRVGEARGVAEKIDAIHPRGSTFLSGGYQRGCDLAAEWLGKGYVTRVLLLSDGLANIGLTRPEALAELTRSMQARGISTTTLGVGLDYNEFLMGQMAEQGGGGAYFIERPEDALGVFQEELAYLKCLAATDVWVTFTPAVAGLAWEQLNTYRREKERFFLANVYGGQRKSLVLECSVPALEGSDEVMLGDIQVSWRSGNAASEEIQTLSLPVGVRLVGPEEFAQVKPERAVTLAAAFLTVARAKREAVRLADDGDYHGAAGMLEKCAAHLASLNLEDQALAEEIRELRFRAERFRHEGARFYQTRERKRLYHEFDMQSKSQLASYAAMRSRRYPERWDFPNLSSTGDSVEYPCYLAAGHPVIETEAGRMLLDTGAQGSFGPIPSIRLGGQSFRLASSYLGQNLDEISQLIGVQLSALLGVDILNRFDWQLDLDAGRWSINRPCSGKNPILLPFEDFMGIPIVTATVAERPVRLFLDTGAKLSYIDSRLLGSAVPQGTGTDFFPGFGAFHTDLHSMSLTLGGQEVQAVFGVLPPTLQGVLAVARVQGILGAELLQNFRLHYSAQRREIGLQPI